MVSKAFGVYTAHMREWLLGALSMGKTSPRKFGGAIHITRQPPGPPCHPKRGGGLLSAGFIRSVLVLLVHHTCVARMDTLPLIMYGY